LNSLVYISSYHLKLTRWFCSLDLFFGILSSSMQNNLMAPLDVRRASQHSINSCFFPIKPTFPHHGSISFWSNYVLSEFKHLEFNPWVLSAFHMDILMLRKSVYFSIIIFLQTTTNVSISVQFSSYLYYVSHFLTLFTLCPLEIFPWKTI
jgi:hypothetical protein